MSTISGTAQAFFDACETGKGWKICHSFCTMDATCSAQSEALAGISTLAQYTGWMKGILTMLPDGRCHLKSFAIDPARNHVLAYGIFSGTHTGPSGPVPLTGKTASADYVYVMEFTGGEISHMTKTWH